MKILILEDEIPAYEKLVSFIEKQIPEGEIVAWGRSIVEAKRLLEKNKNIDLIFSDIELLDGNSFNVFEKVEVNCPIIFCTAFDQYLFKAFQTNGIAYLLKPYNEENFNEAYQKYLKLFSDQSTDNVQNQDLMSQLKTIIDGEKAVFKKRFSIKKKSGIKLVKTEDIVNFEASGDFSFAYDINKEKHIVNYSLGDIEKKLDPDSFFRINRSEIVNVEYVEKIEQHFKNKLALSLKTRTETLYTSSTKTPDFRIWIDK